LLKIIKTIKNKILNTLQLFWELTAGKHTKKYIRVKEHIADGEAMNSAGNSDGAVEEFRAALKLYPRKGQLHSKIAMIYGQEKKYSDAVNELEKALEAGYTHRDTYFTLTRIHRESGNYQEALKNILIASKKGPDDAYLHRELGRLYTESGRFEDALAELEKAREISPDEEEKAKVDTFGTEYPVALLIGRIKGGLFIDVGANFGFYCSLLYRNFENLIAVEPHPDNIRILENIKRANNYTRIKICRAALGSFECENSKLYINEHPGGHSLIENNNKYILIKTLTLNSLLREYPQADLVKIDAEGAEWMILDGAEDVMKKINAFLVELHDITRKEELTDWFRKKGYNTDWITANHIYAQRQLLSSVK